MVILDVAVPTPTERFMVLYGDYVFLCVIVAIVIAIITTIVLIKKNKKKKTDNVNELNNDNKEDVQ